MIFGVLNYFVCSLSPRLCPMSQKSSRRVCVSWTAYFLLWSHFTGPSRFLEALFSSESWLMQAMSQTPHCLHAPPHCCTRSQRHMRTYSCSFIPAESDRYAYRQLFGTLSFNNLFD